MADTDTRTRGNDHCSEEDCVDLARGQAGAGSGTRLQEHLETGCARCADAVRLWRTVKNVAGPETSYCPPESALRQARARFALHKPPRLAERLVRRAALVFDSFRQPLAVGVRSAGGDARYLLYKAGRYTIRVRVEPVADQNRMCIIGQILDDQEPAAALQDIAVLAQRGSQTLDRTLTNHLGEFVLEPDAAENLQLCVGVAEIGTFTVQPKRTGKSGSGRRRQGARRVG